MKLKVFNPHSDLKIDKIKAHSSYLKKKKIFTSYQDRRRIYRPAALGIIKYS